MQFLFKMFYTSLIINIVGLKQEEINFSTQCLFSALRRRWKKDNVYLLCQVPVENANIPVPMTTSPSHNFKPLDNSIFLSFFLFWCCPQDYCYLSRVAHITEQDTYISLDIILFTCQRKEWIFSFHQRNFIDPLILKIWAVEDQNCDFVRLLVLQKSARDVKK